MLTRYEVVRIVGLRMLQINEGATPMLPYEEGESSYSIAVRELVGGHLDVIVHRHGSHYHVSQTRLPDEAYTMLDGLDA